jgi:hypothetical protein
MTICKRTGIRLLLPPLQLKLMMASFVSSICGA